MGQLLAFQTAPRPASRRSSRSSNAAPRSADILFFTGVRYQRHPDAPAAAQGAVPSAPVS